MERIFTSSRLEDIRVREDMGLGTGMSRIVVRSTTRRMRGTFAHQTRIVVPWAMGMVVDMGCRLLWVVGWQVDCYSGMHLEEGSEDLGCSWASGGSPSLSGMG